MTDTQIIIRLTACIVCCIGTFFSAWLLLEMIAEWLVCRFQALRKRFDHARCIAGYNRIAARRGRTIRG